MFSSKLSEEEEGMFGRGGQPSPSDEGEDEAEAWEGKKPPSRVHRAWPMVGLAVLALVAWFSFGSSVRGPTRYSGSRQYLAAVCALG